MWVLCVFGVFGYRGHPRNLDSAEKSGVDEQHFWDCSGLFRTVPDCCGLFRLELQGGLRERVKSEYLPIEIHIFKILGDPTLRLHLDSILSSP